MIGRSMIFFNITFGGYFMKPAIYYLTTLELKFVNGGIDYRRIGWFLGVTLGGITIMTINAISILMRRRKDKDVDIDDADKTKFSFGAVVFLVGVCGLLRV